MIKEEMTLGRAGGRACGLRVSAMQLHLIFVLPDPSLMERQMPSTKSRSVGTCSEMEPDMLSFNTPRG